MLSSSDPVAYNYGPFTLWERVGGIARELISKLANLFDSQIKSFLPVSIEL